MAAPPPAPRHRTRPVWGPACGLVKWRAHGAARVAQGIGAARGKAVSVRVSAL